MFEDYVLYHTGHEINDEIIAKVAKATGLPVYHVSQYQKDKNAIIHGILRGSFAIWNIVKASGKDVIIIDNGYWDGGILHGNYRVSLNGWQQPYVQGNYEWNKDLPPLTFGERAQGEKFMLCPPSPFTASYFKINVDDWIRVNWQAAENAGYKPFVRQKGTGKPFDDDLDGCAGVFSHNSTVCLESLQKGVASGMAEGCLQTYSFSAPEKINNEKHKKIMDGRQNLFAFLSNLQIPFNKLEEKESWAKWKSFVSSLDTTKEKP